jgi:hypothetical protein
MTNSMNFFMRVMKKEERIMKKFIGLMLSIVLLTGILAGCAKTSADSEATTQDAADSTWPRTIEDALGKQITLEKSPNGSHFWILVT